jgi:S-adenosylmethionine:tRNA ribosyltransferase-isomerase
MKKPANIHIEDYNYPLPEDRIAKFPLEKREMSKLLVLKNGKISEDVFKNIPELLPENAMLIFNETKVIQARLQFIKPTGAMIEIFCLEPVEPSGDFQIAFQERSPVVWKCLIGNSKRWKSGTLDTEITVGDQKVILSAEKAGRSSDAFLVRFSWTTEHIFSDILETAGKIPLPPYLNRKPVETDKERYQTVYARLDGSVAAPTAGLHFTPQILKVLERKGFKTGKVTLHVGAGTFKPVSSETIGEHEMHTEKIIVGKAFLKDLSDHAGKPVIPVGTTSMRTIESLFWMAVKLKNGLTDDFVVEQWDPYELDIPDGFDAQAALAFLTDLLEKRHLDEIKGETRLMIAPGYDYKIADGIITNFHQPKSTLLLLVSALIGEKWREAYQYALDHDFRFLSYGDSCLFLPER